MLFVWSLRGGDRDVRVRTVAMGEWENEMSGYDGRDDDDSDDDDDDSNNGDDDDDYEDGE